MGGRGASSGISKSGHKYGTEYRTILQSGNIKYVKYNFGNATAPMETMTKGRIYVTLNDENKPMTITYYDDKNKRERQIDLLHKHNGKIPHTHHGYFHNENDYEGGASKLTAEEKNIVEKIEKIWYNNKRKR